MRYACTVAELGAPGSPRAVTLGAREIVLVRTDGRRARDRPRLPARGLRRSRRATSRATTLTCVWHGWRFDLRSGACLVAGEDVRTYARGDPRRGDLRGRRRRDDRAGARAASEALVAALETGRPTLAARRCARLLDLGAGVDHVALLLVRYGATHADAGLDAGDRGRRRRARGGRAAATRAASRYLFADVAAGPGRAPRPCRAALRPRAGVVVRVGRRGRPRHAGCARRRRGRRGGRGGRRRHGRRGACPASEIGAGLALGLARSYRGPWPLIVLERAVRLADLLGEDAARVVLPVAAHGCACAPEAGGREPFRSAVDAVAGNDADPARVIAACSRAMPANDRDGTLLLSGLALAYADAARWAVDRAGTAARPLVLHAEALLHALGGQAGRRPRPCPRRTWPVDLASGPASTPRGLAICLAAAVVAWRTPDSAVTSGVHRLLVLPKRERFTERHVDGEGLELP